MKKFNKSIIFVIVLSLMVYSTMMSASAFSPSDGTPCGGIQNSCNAERQNSSCTSGSCINSILGGLNCFGSSASNDKSGCNNAADKSNNCPTENQSNQWTDIVKQYINNCTGNTADNNSVAVAEDETKSAANSENKTAPATENAPCDNDAATTGDTGNSVAPNSDAKAPDENSTANTENSNLVNSNTNPNATAKVGDSINCSTGNQTEYFLKLCQDASNKAKEYLDAIYKECGLYLNELGICPSGDPATEPPGTTDNTGDTNTNGTTPPSYQTDPNAAQDQNVDNLSFEQRVVDLVNEQRAANGLSPLTLNEKLSNVARFKSQDMHDNNYFSHTSPTYGSPFDMLTSFGISYRSAGENIAMGYSTPEEVMNTWMNSSGHRANILNASYTQIGVGYVADGHYWTQEFIG